MVATQEGHAMPVKLRQLRTTLTPPGNGRSRDSMQKPNDPRELAVAMISRSICSVGVGAVLADKHGIFAWAPNHIGFDGYGMHAEAFCLRRANKRRLSRATLYVAAARRRNGKTVTARPCHACQQLIRGVGRVVYRNQEGEWLPL